MYQTITKKILADTYTPVSIYQKVKQQYPKSVLLESSDYHSKQDSFSIIGFKEIASIELENDMLKTQIKGKTTTEKIKNLSKSIESFRNSFHVQSDEISKPFSGIYGFTGFDATEQFEPKLKNESSANEIPTCHYSFFEYLIVFNHFNNELIIIRHVNNDDTDLSEAMKILEQPNHAFFNFSISEEEESTPSRSKYLELVDKGIDHCLRGDVFQIVLSRQFKQTYDGDEFQVYRTLRNINPSPYLFFFDFGNFSLFGSSPEAHIKLTDGNAEIHPIAGTYKRTGDYQLDSEQSLHLLDDPKENAEHIMLVDLARNDLSRSCENVEVTKLKELQFFSHVIHMVSKVEGKLSKDASPESLLQSSFPAGTLSGAPKIKALELIQKYEVNKRNFYGGAIGSYSFSGNINHAIIIRSLLAKNKVLTYQAGAGIVAKSDPTSELNEIDNKINAVRRAITNASNLAS